MSRHVTTEVGMDVAGNLAMGMAVMGAAVDGIFAGIERAREDEMDAVQSLVAELGRARRAAASAKAETAQARAEIARLRVEADVRLQEARMCAGRADRAEHALARVLQAVHAQA